VLVLDQFPRSIHRGTPRAFAGDAAAQRLAIDAFDRGEHLGLAIEEQNFLIMPLVHSEHLPLHARAIELMDALIADAPEPLRPIFGMGSEQSRKYHEVISRFGRFPHRNAALGRESTPDEVGFLEDWAARQPPAGMR
jgi:uncharacterized protein (DUF924 family)